MIRIVFLLLCATWAVADTPVNCEISNTGGSGGIASINAATGQGFSAPGGIGASSFRVRIPCITKNISFHIWQVDTSASSSPNTYDIGLYCIAGDCADTLAAANKLMLHTGVQFGNNFTNNRTVATVTATAAQSAGVLTLTGTFLQPDWPVGGKVTITTCSPFNGTWIESGWSSGHITIALATTGTASGCTVKSAINFPVGFTGPGSNCNSGTTQEQCQEAFPWIVDARTICTALPCTLPAGLYAVAFGTTCSSATATNCAQALGDDDQGQIYAVQVSASTYDAAGLPANLTFPTVGPTTAKWNTTPGTSAPIKPVKVLIY